MPSNHLILCHPLLLPPSIFLSIRVYSNELVLHIRWTKYWSFSFSISPSNEYSGLISFRMDWLDLLTVQGTLKSLLQHHSSTLPLPITFGTTLPLTYSYLHLEYSLLLLQVTNSKHLRHRFWVIQSLPNCLWQKKVSCSPCFCIYLLYVGPINCEFWTQRQGVFIFFLFSTSLVVQIVKNLPTMQ